MDLGWLPLWHTAVVAAIVLKQKMAHSDPKQLHTKWMGQAAPLLTLGRLM